MATEFVGVFLDTIGALFTGLGTSIMDIFSELIYNETDGLTILAEWMLVFMGFSFAIGIFFALWRKVA